VSTATQPDREPVSPEQRGRSAPIRLLAVLAVVLLLGAGFFALRLQVQYEEASRRETRAQALIAAVNYAELCLMRMESAIRHYVLSGEESQLAYYADMDRRLRTELGNIEALASGNEAQRGHIAGLHRLIDLKRENLGPPAALRRAGRTDDAVQWIRSPETWDSTEAIRKQVNRIEREERSQLAFSEAEAARVSAGTTRMIVAGNLVAILFATTAFYLCYRSNRAQARAEQRLQAVNRLQLAVLDGTVHSVISTDAAGVITLFSRGAERMLGYSAAELVGRSTPERLHLAGEVAARAMELSVQLGRPVAPGFEVFVTRARLGETDEREWTYVRKDGSRLPVRLVITALHDETGRIAGFVGIAHDLSEQKKAEITLQASEERLGQVLGHAECLVWEAKVTLRRDDWDWRMSVYPSGLYRRLTADYSQDGGTGLWYKFEVSEQQEMNRRARDAMERGLSGYAQEFRVCKDGRTTWLRETVSIRPQDEGHHWLVGVVIDISDRKRAEEALAASEQQFRNAFDYAGIGMALVGLDGRWLQVNRLVPSMFGYAEAELLVRTFQDITHPDDLQADLANVQDLLASRRRHYQMEKRYLHRAGRVVHVRLTVTLVRTATGEPLHFISQMEDITARHKVEQALLASQRQLNDVFRSMAEGLVVHDAEGRIVECNAAAEGILGLTRAQLFGMPETDPRWQALHEDGTPCPGDDMPSSLTRRTLQPQRDAIIGVRKGDGSLRWLSVNTEVILDEHGVLQSVVASFTDVTERKEAERHLRDALAEAQRFREAQDSIPSFVYMKDTHSRYLYANRPTLELFGCTAEELVGSTDERFFGPATARELRASDERVLAGEISNREVATTDKQGRMRYYWEVKTPIYADAERRQIWGLLGISTDITERKELLDSLSRARDEALEASRLKSAFLANMSHEIRTPMNGVLGMADLLMESALNGEQQQMARVIQNSARNLLTIIDDILDLSKIEAGKLAMEVREFDLGEQVDQALALLSPRAQARALQLDSDLPDKPLPRVRGDATRLQQVFVNLLGNAIKFTERGGVTLAVRELPASVPGCHAFRVEVRDTGIGITPEQQARLFLPFSQADTSTTRKYGGTGLGLAICKQLVDLMGGRIGVQSESGRGSTFWVEIELPQAGPAAPRAVVPARQPVPSAPRARILVAEDNEANQLVIRLMLDKLGLDHDIVGDGPSALRQLEQGGYAAVLMDCQMPGLDGYEATQRIRDGAAGAAQAHIPIFALTAHAMASDREKCIEAGMNDYLPKPVRLEVLQQALARFGIATAPLQMTGAGSPVEAVIDPAHLDELRSLPGENDRETLLDLLIRRALVDLPEGFHRLHAHAEAHAAGETAQLAHRLAGSAASIGAVALRSGLLLMEQAARKNDWAAVAVQRSALDRQWQLLQDALRSLSRPPGP